MPSGVGKPLTNTSLFIDIKKTLRLHPDWDDETITVMFDLRGPMEKGLIATARKDLEAG